MKLIGYFVVGDGKFGEYLPGREFISTKWFEESKAYWSFRGYGFVEVFIKDQ